MTRSRSERLGLGSFEIADDITISQKNFRIIFFREINSIVGDVAVDLYQKAFFQFVLLGWLRFPQTIPAHISSSLQDRKLLADLERTTIDASVFPYDADTKSIHPAIARLLYPVITTMDDPLLFENYPRMILMRELLRPLRELFKNVPPAFRNWAALRKIKDSVPLCESIVEWSKDWNLDADWCRNFAVAALSDWLADEWLQLHLQWHKYVLSFSKATFDIWREDTWTVQKNVFFPKDNSKEKLLADLIHNFKFTWKGLEFEHYRWNVLSRYKDEWTRECDKEFIAYLAQRKEKGDIVPTGVLGRFRTTRDKYIRNAERAAEQIGLVKTPRRWANEHVTWAVRFQVQKWSLSKIAKAYSKPRKTISDGINRTLDFIVLTRRPDLPAGMPKGTRLRAN